MAQTQPRPGPRQPAQRLLRPPAPTALPAPQRLPDCPDLQTTPEFLPVHIRQRDDTITLIDQAEQRGAHRLAANLWVPRTVSRRLTSAFATGPTPEAVARTAAGTIARCGCLTRIPDARPRAELTGAAPRSDATKDIEILMRRHELAVVRRHNPHPAPASWSSRDAGLPSAGEEPGNELAAGCPRVSQFCGCCPVRRSWRRAGDGQVRDLGG